MPRMQNPNLDILINELSVRFQRLLQYRQSVDAVSGHMPSDAMSQARVPRILEIIRKISGIGEKYP